MSKKIAILQSNYVPWKGYFDMIGMVDEFVIYDEVQYTKNDWRNRNKIKTLNGLQWLTIPVIQTHLHQKISETRIFDKRWNAKHWNSLVTNYSKAPYFKSYPELEQFYRKTESDLLSEINVALIRLICSFLNITTTITNSSEYILEGNATERLVNICRQSNASCYLSGPAARNYLNEELFKRNGIGITWMDYSGYADYNQLHPPFAHDVSIVDLLFNTGPEAVNHMKFRKG